MSPGARLFLPYMRREWRSLATVGVTTGVAAAAELAKPIPLALVVNAIIAEAGGPTGFTLDGGDLWLLAGVAALVIGIALVESVATYISDLKLKRAGERITHDLRLETHAELQRLSLGYHARRPAGDLVTRVTSDVNAVGSLLSESLGTVVSSVLLLGGMLVVAFVIDPILALTAFAMAPALALAAIFNRRKLKAAAKRQRRHEGEIAALTTEGLGAIREVKALGSESRRHEELRRKSEERREAGIETYRIEARYTRVIDVIAALGAAAVLVVGVLRVAAGAVSAGELVVMVSYTKRLARPLRDLARQAGRITRSLVRADRIAEVLDAGEKLEDRPGAYRGGRASGALTLEDVAFAYDGHEVLRDVRARIEPGERVSLVGPSGAGKSTLAALVARFYDPTHGRVRLDGRDLRDCSLEWLRDQVGVLLQEPMLFTGTVAENIAYGVEDASREEIAEAARAAGAHEFVEGLPQGYDTVLGNRGEGLSGGQKQRLAIARTLLRDPPVLILDEPTTGLDEASERDVVNGLERLVRGRTTLVITHSPELAALADRTIALRDGTVADAPEAGRDDVVPAPRRGLPPVPRDHALPSLRTLLDPEAMAPRLAASLGGAAELTDVRLRYLRYKPGTNVVVHYDVGLDGGRRHDATVMTAADGCLARRARRPETLALASRTNGLAPGRTPLAYDDEIDALVQWFPLDLSLPALAEPRAVLRDELAAVGARVGHHWPDADVLAYKPRRRAVLRVGGDVVKLYAKEEEFAAAAHGLRASGRIGLACPAPGGMLASRRVTVQRHLAGSQPSPEAAAEPAGRMLAALHASSPCPLPYAPPSIQLKSAAATTGLLGALSEPLGRRAEALLARLARELPVGLPLVTSHGDFNARQLLVTEDGRLALVDFDALCDAPAALDLATYASYVVLGDSGGLERANAVLEALVDGYGARPPALGWYLATCILRRSARPFRYLEPDWPERMEVMLEAAGAVA